MNHRVLRARVRAAEARAAASLQHNAAAWSAVRDNARRSLTPARLLGAGFVSGLLLGIIEPLARLTQGTRFVELATRLVSLVGSVQAQFASDVAGRGVDTTQRAGGSDEARPETVREPA